MMCLGDLETAVREDLPLLVVVYIKKDVDLDALFVS
jgi:thiamine pyrophosphate-dependent acetolactate synthase large subunit-like protein